MVKISTSCVVKLPIKFSRYGSKPTTLTTASMLFVIPKNAEIKFRGGISQAITLWLPESAVPQESQAEPFSQLCQIHCRGLDH